MKQKISFIFVILYLAFFICTISADTWLHTYDPFPWDDLWNVEDVIECADGGFAVNGTYVGDTFFSWGFLLKTDSEGNFEWADMDTVSFQSANESWAIVETEDGGILSASYFNSSQGCTSLIKRDVNGNREWVEPLNDIYILSMSKTSDYNIIVTGYSPYNNQAWPSLTKLDQDAEIIWSHTYVLDNYEWGVIKSVIQSSDGGYLLTGHVKDNVTEDAILVIKTDAEGDSLWTRVIDATSLDDRGYTIVEAGDGDIIVGGRTGYPQDLSGFICKLDINGNLIWMEDCGYEVTSFTKSNDGSIIALYGDEVYWNSIMKFSSDYSIEWSNDLPYYNGSGDKAVKVTSTNNIIVALNFPSNIGLIKLNPDGTEVEENIVNMFETVLNVYPNPFNPITNFYFSLEEDCSVKLVIYNIKGQKVKTLVNEDLETGFHEYIWNSRNDSGKQVPSGVYFYRLNTNGKTKGLKKMLLLK